MHTLLWYATGATLIWHARVGNCCVLCRCTVSTVMEPRRLALPSAFDNADGDQDCLPTVDDQRACLVAQLAVERQNVEVAQSRVAFLVDELSLFDLQHSQPAAVGGAATATEPLHPLVKRFRADRGGVVETGYRLSLGMLLGLPLGKPGEWKPDQELLVASMHYRQNILYSNKTGFGKTTTTVLLAVYRSYFADPRQPGVTVIISPLVVTVANLVADVNRRLGDGFAYARGNDGSSGGYGSPAAASADAHSNADYDLTGPGSVYRDVLQGCNQMVSETALYGRVGAILVLTPEQLTLTSSAPIVSLKRGLCHLITKGLVWFVWDEVHLQQFAMYRESSLQLAGVLAGLRAVNRISPPPISALSSTCPKVATARTMDSISSGAGWIEARHDLANVNLIRVTFLDESQEPTCSGRCIELFGYLNEVWYPLHPLKEHEKILILTDTARQARAVCAEINAYHSRDGQAVVYHAQGDCNRTEAMRRLESGPEYRVLVATAGSVNHGMDKPYFAVCVEFDNPATSVEFHEQGLGRAGRGRPRQLALVLTFLNVWTLNRGVFMVQDDPSRLLPKMFELVVALASAACRQEIIMTLLHSPGTSACKACSHCTLKYRPPHQSAAVNFDGAPYARPFLLHLIEHHRANSGLMSYRVAAQLFVANCRADLDGQERIRLWVAMLKDCLMPTLDVAVRSTRTGAQKRVTLRLAVVRSPAVERILFSSGSLWVPGVPVPL